MSRARWITLAAIACVLTSSCGDSEPDASPNATSTDYMFENVFNPCREVPEQFRAKNELGTDDGGVNLPLDSNATALGCAYRAPQFDFYAGVSSVLLSELGREIPNRYVPTEVAGRAARIWSRPLEPQSCQLEVEISGGVLSLGVARVRSSDPCVTLTDMAEELVPQLPPGA